MQIFSKIFSFLSFSKKNEITSGPNNLEELLLQFDLPKKEKSLKEIINDYMIKETIVAVEVDYLRNCPNTKFVGTHKFKDHSGNVYFDWVPCSIRPEVVYCSYGKN